MAKVIDPSGGNLNGKVGDIVYYQINGKSYARKAPGKQTKAQKKNVSPLKKLSQDKMGKTQKYLRLLSKVISFGFQEFEEGARRSYHACASYTLSNCFIHEDGGLSIDPSLFKMSRGTLLQPEETKAERLENGILFTWKNNSWKSSAKPWDKAFIVLHNPTLNKVEWEFLGSSRESEKHLFPLTSSQMGTNWHAYMAFSQEKSGNKKYMLSDSVYLGLI